MKFEKFKTFEELTICATVTILREYDINGKDQAFQDWDEFVHEEKEKEQTFNKQPTEKVDPFYQRRKRHKNNKLKKDIENDYNDKYLEYKYIQEFKHKLNLEEERLNHLTKETQSMSKKMDKLLDYPYKIVSESKLSHYHHHQNNTKKLRNNKEKFSDNISMRSHNSNTSQSKKSHQDLSVCSISTNRSYSSSQSTPSRSLKKQIKLKKDNENDADNNDNMKELQTMVHTMNNQMEMLMNQMNVIQKNQNVLLSSQGNKNEKSQKQQKKREEEEEEMKEHQEEIKGDLKENDLNEDEKKVKEWLENKVKLGQYFRNFINEGFDDLDVISEIKEEQLNAMGIKKMGHRIKILKKVKLLNQQ